MMRQTPEGRIFVPIEAIPLHVRQAFVSAEDKNFYDHAGVDWLQRQGDGTKCWRCFSRRHVSAGGSTITMQTIKNFVVGSERTAEQNFEMFIAQRLERQLTKDEILERYLNENYGNRAYGIAAAAPTYFDKSVRDLTVTEAAVLASLPKAPSTTNPFVDPEGSRARRDYVLGEMADNGYISREDADAYQEQDLTVNPRSQANVFRAPYFAAEVQRQMTRAYGPDFAREGFAVRTTLDEELQGWGEQALWDGMVRYDEGTSYRGPLDQLPLIWGLANRICCTILTRLKDWEAAIVTEIHRPCSDAVRTDETGVERPINEIACADSNAIRLVLCHD